MRVGLTGWNGFLAQKLRERTDVEWVNGTENIDLLFHLGSPTFTAHELTRDDAQVMHRYVKDSMELISKFSGPVMFGSTTGVDDICLTHNGSTSYNLGKLFLESYVLNNCDKYMIMRIGTIYSDSVADVAAMKQDRVQPRIMRGDLKDIPFEDWYLNVNTFVGQTMDAIQNFNTGIFEYNLVKLRMTQLRVKQ